MKPMHLTIGAGLLAAVALSVAGAVLGAPVDYSDPSETVAGQSPASPHAFLLSARGDGPDVLAQGLLPLTAVLSDSDTGYIVGARYTGVDSLGRGQFLIIIRDTPTGYQTINASIPSVGSVNRDSLATAIQRLQGSRWTAVAQATVMWNAWALRVLLDQPPSVAMAPGETRPRSLNRLRNLHEISTIDVSRVALGGGSTAVDLALLVRFGDGEIRLAGTADHRSVDQEQLAAATERVALGGYAKTDTGNFFVVVPIAYLNDDMNRRLRSAPANLGSLGTADSIFLAREADGLRALVWLTPTLSPGLKVAASALWSGEDLKLQSLRPTDIRCTGLSPGSCGVESLVQRIVITRLGQELGGKLLRPERKLPMSVGSVSRELSVPVRTLRLSLRSEWLEISADAHHVDHARAP